MQIVIRSSGVRESQAPNSTKVMAIRNRRGTATNQPAACAFTKSTQRYRGFRTRRRVALNYINHCIPDPIDRFSNSAGIINSASR
jgi:hypothetical protein